MTGHITILHNDNDAAAARRVRNLLMPLGRMVGMVCGDDSNIRAVNARLTHSSLVVTLWSHSARRDSWLLGQLTLSARARVPNMLVSVDPDDFDAPLGLPMIALSTGPAGVRTAVRAAMGRPQLTPPQPPTSHLGRRELQTDGRVRNPLFTSAGVQRPELTPRPWMMTTQAAVARTHGWGS
ncbi:MAG: hypothetical protein KC502_01185 [Myxococcales bacterium]|nr:hypothetical protein [Myxococcales bacterium]